MAPLSRALMLALCFLCFPASLRSFAVVELPEEEVTGSPVFDVETEDKYLSPGAVTVVRPSDYAGEQRSLPDLLDEVPGLRVIRLHGRNGYSVASVRGSTSSQVAVYVDGILMNLQSEAAVDLSAIPVEQVERIEVYKGYVPSRFGAQAMGGVINIVTRSPDTPEANVSLGVGSFGKHKGSLSYSSALGGGKFFGSFGYEAYDGDFEYWNDNGTAYNRDDDYTGKRKYNGFENADILLKWQDEHWRARASWIRRNRDLSLTAPGRDKQDASWEAPGALLDTTRMDLSLGRSQASGDIDWGWEVFYAAQEKDYDSRRGNMTFSPLGASDVLKSEYDASRLGISFNAGVPVGERHFLELLAEYSAERLDVGGDMLPRLNYISRYDRKDWNFNLQDTITLDRAGTFLATPSIRWHKLDGEDHFTWQVALTKEFSPNWMIKSAFGTYARAPNMYERYGDGAFILQADSDLEWETGKQLDLGLLWNGVLNIPGNPAVNASLSGFWREADDLIEFNMENPILGKYYNLTEAEVKGIELEASLEWEKWGFSGAVTWMDAINQSPATGSYLYAGKKLPNRPEWSGVARLTRKFSRGSVFVEYQYVGENYVDRIETVLFDARNVFNIGLKYDLSPSTHLTVGVDDVFDDADKWRMRPEGGLNGPTRMLWYPVEGRSYYLTLDMEL